MKKPKYIKVIQRLAFPIGELRSFPAEIGSASPSVTVQPPNPMEHPIEMSTAAGIEIKLTEPANDSTLAIEYPPEPQVVQPAPAE